MRWIVARLNTKKTLGMASVLPGTYPIKIYSVNFMPHYFFKHFDWMLLIFNQSKRLKNSIS